MSEPKTSGKMHVVADKAVEMFRLKDSAGQLIEFEYLSCRQILADPANRDGLWLNHTRIHELIFMIITSGFSLAKCLVGIVVEIEGDQLDPIMTHNISMTQGNPMLPEVDMKQKNYYSCVHTNHFAMICRCFIYKVPTTEANLNLGITDSDGKLSLEHLKHVSPEFYNYVHHAGPQGHQTAE